MYRIQGADQKEYGPIAAEQVRQWIAENRLNRFTLCAGADGVWKPLGQFAEFADVLGQAGIVPGPAASGSTTPAALGSYAAGEMGSADAERRVKAPAICLIILAAISIIQALASPFTTKAQMQAMVNQPGLDANTRQVIASIGSMSPLFWGGVALFFVLYNGLIILGAVRMMKLRSFGLALTAAILSMLPCTACCCLGLPLGIWAAMTLNRPDVKPHFQN